jgi:hypothetical protein
MATPLHHLLSAAAVRERAHEMLELALQGAVESWVVDLDRLPEAAELTAKVTRASYPDLRIPFHARWRHFVAGDPALPTRDPAERGRAAFDLVILSVLLDAGAGPDWRFRDGASGKVLGRSEGLGVASQRMFEAGAFSSDPAAPLRADGAALAGLEPETLARGFQVDAANPMVGLDGRSALLRRWAGRCWRGRTCSPPPTCRARAGCSTSLPPAPKVAAFPPPPFSSFCWRRWGRSGRTGW